VFDKVVVILVLPHLVGSFILIINEAAGINKKIQQLEKVCWLNLIRIRAKMGITKNKEEVTENENRSL